MFAFKKSDKDTYRNGNSPFSEYEDFGGDFQNGAENGKMPELSADESRMDGNLVMITKPQSFEAEQFRILRTNLLFPASGQAPRSIMVTSALPGEGKSFISANLAVSIAQNVDNKYALLIDGDMHMPCIHRRFGFGEAPGLSEHLSADIPLSSLLLRTTVKRLTIMPGGKPPYNPSELLSSEKMSALLKEVQSRYNDRYTVIDSPPPKLTAETSVIARQVDGVLLVVKYGSTPRKEVAQLIDIIGKDRVLGIITNWADTSTTYRLYRKHIKRK